MKAAHLLAYCTIMSAVALSALTIAAAPLKKGRTTTLQIPDDAEPRYSVRTLDVAEAARTPCACFVVPRGREHEFVFSSDEGLAQVAASAKCARLLVVNLDPSRAGHAPVCCCDDALVELRRCFAAPRFSADRDAGAICAALRDAARCLLHEFCSPAAVVGQQVRSSLERVELSAWRAQTRQLFIYFSQNDVSRTPATV